MDIEFDPDKDAINIAKHGLSLGRLVEMENVVVVPDDRFAEDRFRFYGVIDRQPHCAAVTFRDDTIRVINLRRAHAKEYRRYVG